mmetsp:Transcript_104649/g.335397  ORF Transcript_104649/g.335397 Transcript_104649/m.335397 type:complete len:255 (-) Transcript_104649:1660-2424(-)
MQGQDDRRGLQLDMQVRLRNLCRGPLPEHMPDRRLLQHFQHRVRAHAMWRLVAGFRFPGSCRGCVHMQRFIAWSELFDGLPRWLQPRARACPEFGVPSGRQLHRCSRFHRQQRCSACDFVMHRADLCVWYSQQVGRAAQLQCRLDRPDVHCTEQRPVRVQHYECHCGPRTAGDLWQQWRLRGRVACSHAAIMLRANIWRRSVAHLRRKDIRDGVLDVLRRRLRRRLPPVRLQTHRGRHSALPRRVAGIVHQCDE